MAARAVFLSFKIFELAQFFKFLQICLPERQF
jgi:hypothetical protein